MILKFITTFSNYFYHGSKSNLFVPEARTLYTLKNGHKQWREIVDRENILSLLKKLSDL